MYRIVCKPEPREGEYHSALQYCCALTKGLIRRCSPAFYRRFRPWERCGYRRSAGMKSTLFCIKIFKLLTLLSVANVTYAARSSLGQLVVGEDTNCENEGEIVRVDFLTDNSCFKCICKRGKVECKSTCQERPDCYSPVKRKGDCCPKCLDCRYGKQYLNMTQDWLPGRRENPCERLFCKDGIITKASLQCFVPCKDPLPTTADQCCPSCAGCFFNGTTYREGDLYPLAYDHCTKCSCQNGTVACSRKPCPVLPCKSEDYNLTEDGCCMECVGHRLRNNVLPGYCTHAGRVLAPGEKIVVDECTKCRCQLGTLVCDFQTCPVYMPCPVANYVHRPNECCPLCRADVPKDCFDEKDGRHKEGSSWTKGRDSCKSCSCVNESITCDVIECGKAPTCDKGYTLELVPGKCCRTCVRERAVCSVFGDPHYRTFDGRPFNFQGDCRYMMARDCGSENFTVEVQNNAKTSTSYSWTKSVYVTLRFGRAGKHVKTISLHQHLEVRVNGKGVAFPYISRTVVVWIERHVAKVRARNGLALDWDGDSFLEVGVSDSYKKQTCGLCGNYNGFARDDFIGGDGSFHVSADSFADSWKRELGKCTRREVLTRSTNPCGRSMSQKLYAYQRCFVFKTKAFQACHDTIDPRGYYESCVTDTCECPRSRKCSCESISAYASACKRQGVKIVWNRAQHCEESCRGGKVYSECGPSCVRTCRSHVRLKSNKSCSEKCVPGCHCPAGHVVHKRQCVRTSECHAILKKDLYSRRINRKRRRKARNNRFRRIKALQPS